MSSARSHHSSTTSTSSSSNSTITAVKPGTSSSISSSQQNKPPSSRASGPSPPFIPPKPDYLSSNHLRQESGVVYTPPSTASESGDENPFEDIVSPHSQTTASSPTIERDQREEIFGTEPGPARRQQRFRMMPSTNSSNQHYAPYEGVPRSTGRRKLSNDGTRTEVRRLMGQSLKEAHDKTEKVRQDQDRMMEELKRDHQLEIARITTECRQQISSIQQRCAAELKEAKQLGDGKAIVEDLEKLFVEQLRNLMVEKQELKRTIRNLQRRLGEEALDTFSKKAGQKENAAPQRLQIHLRFTSGKSYDVPTLYVPHLGLSFKELHTAVHCAVSNYLCFLRSKDSVHCFSPEAGLAYSLETNLANHLKILFFGNGDMKNGEEVTEDKWKDRGWNTPDVMALIALPSPPSDHKLSVKGSAAPSVSGLSRASHRVPTITPEDDQLPPPTVSSSIETASRTSAIFGRAASRAPSEHSYDRSTIHAYSHRTTETIHEVPSPRDDLSIQDDSQVGEDAVDFQRHLAKFKEGEHAADFQRHLANFQKLKEQEGLDADEEGDEIVEEDETRATDPLLTEEDNEDDDDEEEVGNGVDLVGHRTGSDRINPGSRPMSDTARLLADEMREREASSSDLSHEEHQYEMVGEGADGGNTSDEEDTGRDVEQDDDDEDGGNVPLYSDQPEDENTGESMPLYVNEFLMGPVLESTIKSKGKEREQNPFHDSASYTRDSISARSSSQRGSIQSLQPQKTASSRTPSIDRSQPIPDTVDEGTASEESEHLLGDDMRDSDGEAATPRPRDNQPGSPASVSAQTVDSRPGGVGTANPWGGSPYYQPKQPAMDEPQMQKPMSTGPYEDFKKPKYESFGAQTREQARKDRDRAAAIIRQAMEKAQHEREAAAMREAWVQNTIAESAPLSRSTSASSEFVENRSNQRSRSTSIQSRPAPRRNMTWDPNEAESIRREMQMRDLNYSYEQIEELGRELEAEGRARDAFAAGIHAHRERSISQSSGLSSNRNGGSSYYNMKQPGGPFYDTVPSIQNTGYDPVVRQGSQPQFPYISSQPPPGFERQNPFRDNNRMYQQPSIQEHIEATRSAFANAGIDPNQFSNAQIYEIATATPDVQRQQLAMLLQNHAGIQGPVVSPSRQVMPPWPQPIQTQSAPVQQAPPPGPLQYHPVAPPPPAHPTHPVYMYPNTQPQYSHGNSPFY